MAVSAERSAAAVGDTMRADLKDPNLESIPPVAGTPPKLTGLPASFRAERRSAKRSAFTGENVNIIVLS